MFENYTDKAAHVLKQAKKVSAECGQSYVGTEHILIALLREDSCAAAELLAERKVDKRAYFPGGRRGPGGAQRLYATGGKGAL